jgi:hypothetical protein
MCDGLEIRVLCRLMPHSLFAWITLRFSSSVHRSKVALLRHDTSHTMVDLLKLSEPNVAVTIAMMVSQAHTDSLVA